jgi:hypothetical protein
MTKKTIEVTKHRKVIVGEAMGSPASIAVSNLEFTNPDLTCALFHYSEVTLQLNFGYHGANNGNLVLDLSELYDIRCGKLTPKCETNIVLGIQDAIKHSKVLIPDERAILSAMTLAEISLYYNKPRATIRRYLTPRNMARNFWKKLEEAGMQGDPEPVDLTVFVNFGDFVSIYSD